MPYIGQAHAGATVGLMNTASQVGGLLGWRVGISWIAPVASMRLLIQMVAPLFLGAVLWLKIDAPKEVREEVQAEPVGAAHKRARLNPASVSLE